MAIINATLAAGSVTSPLTNRAWVYFGIHPRGRNVSAL